MRTILFSAPTVFRTNQSAIASISPIYKSTRPLVFQRSTKLNSRSVVTMASAEFKYVIVGAGNSAGYAARQFVSAGLQPDTLCIIGDESVVPYERPALSKAVLVNENVRLPGFHTCVGSGGDKQPPDWYDSNSVTLRLSQRVNSIDAKAKSASLADGSTISATEALIVATGASAVRLSKVPGNDLSGVCYLRNYNDALKLFDALQGTKGEPVVIMGGGYIGMEVAAAAVTVGCKVTMVFPEEHMMSRLFTPEIAEKYEAVYRAKGVHFVNNGALGKAFVANDSGSAVSAVTVGRDGADDEDVPASLVVVGVGARPETDLLRDQVEFDDRGGIIVNGQLQTSVDGVYAIGDIATFPVKMYGNRQARMEHVQNCRDMAEHVVNVIVKGDRSDYDYLPYFYSRVFGLSWQFFGDSAGECILVCDASTDDMVNAVMNGSDIPQMLAIWVDDGVVQGIFMESPTSDNTANMKRVARERPSVDTDKFSKCDSVSDAWSLLS